MSRAGARADLIYGVVFALAVAIRLLVASLNLEANDDHLEVVRRMLAGSSARIGDCWQCYHPKLFHSLCAGLCTLLGRDDALAQTRACELLNVALGAGTLLVLLAFVRRAAPHPALGIVGFAVFAFAPSLMGIDAQATNDSLLIFLSSVALYGLWRFLQSERPAHLAQCLVAALLAAATKGSGLLLFGFVSLYAVAVGLGRRRAAGLDRRPLAVLLACQVAFVAYLPFSTYALNAEDRDNPLALNVEPRAPAPLLRRELVADAGVASVSEALATFRWLALISFPYLTNSSFVYPAHRRSLWSMAYGQHFFSRFASHPRSWRTRMPFPTAIGRAALALGVVPLALLLLGMLRAASSFAVEWRARGLVRALALSTTPLLLASCLFLVMLVWLSLTYRSYATMKAIYLYPALLGFASMFLEGGSLLWNAHVPSWARRAVLASLLILCLVHVVDGSTLAYDLARPSPPVMSESQLVASPPALSGRDELLTALEPEVSPRQTETWTRDQNIDGRPLQTGERIHSAGFGARAPSTLKFRLGRRYASLRLGMGLDDLAPGGGAVRLEIASPEKVLHRSSLLLPGETEWAEIDVSSVDRLLLKAHPADRDASPQVVWVDPVLTRK